MQTLLSALGSTRNAKVNQTLATQRDFKIEPIVIHPIERYMTIARLYPHLESLGTRIIVVETPGLDPGETAKGYTDLDKLKGLASWLSEKWSVMLIHKITDMRAKLSSKVSQGNIFSSQRWRYYLPPRHIAG